MRYGAKRKLLAANNFKYGSYFCFYAWEHERQFAKCILLKQHIIKKQWWYTAHCCGHCPWSGVSSNTFMWKLSLFWEHCLEKNRGTECPKDTSTVTHNWQKHWVLLEVLAFNIYTLRPQICYIVHTVTSHLKPSCRYQQMWTLYC